MNLFPLMEELLDELDGYQKCENCQSEDIFYALDGTCSECHMPINRHDDNTTFLFAITIIQYFIKEVDVLMPPLHKNVILEALSQDINYCRTKGKIVEDDEILRLQAFFANTGAMGNEKEGVAITIKNLKPEVGIDFKLPEPMVRAKSMACVISSLNFLLKFRVKNEVVLRPQNIENRILQQNEPPKKGCLGTIVFLFVISICSLIIFVRYE